MSEAYFTLEGRLQEAAESGAGRIDPAAALAAVMQAPIPSTALLYLQPPSPIKDVASMM